MSKIENENITVNLLWTGGWDSTFQLLQLLLIYKHNVSPYYSIHEKRPSTLKEIRVMEKIKNQIIKDYPHTKELLQATQYHAVGDILPNTEISSAYRSILKKCHVGEQYEWLARFCNEKGIKKMQLSIQAHIKPDPNQFNIKPLLKATKIGDQEVYLIDPKFKNTDEYKIFGHFTFPLMKLTKVQMKEISVEKGWEKIMDMTWFCHNPTRKEKPCGICKPCIIALDESFGWRIPLGRRIISFYYRKIFWPVKSKLRSLLISMGLYSEKIKDHSA